MTNDTGSDNGTFVMPPQHTVDDLVRLGTNILVAANLDPTSYYSNNSTIAKLKMPKLVSFLLENRTEAVKLVRPMLGTNATNQQAIDEMEKLVTLISNLRHDVPTITFYLVALAFPVVAVALRLYVRKFVRGRIRVEDWLALVALLWLLGLMGMFCKINLTAFHIWDMSFKEYKYWQFINWFVGPFFCVAHFLVKTTFLVFYYSLSPDRTYQYAIYAVGAYVASFSIAGVFALIFVCKPVNFWEHLGTAKCYNKKLSLVAFCVLYIVADFMILAIPSVIVWKAHFRWKEKIVATAMFGMMAFVCILSIKRLISVETWWGSADPTYAVAVDHGPWASSELDFSLVIACLPALNALFPMLRFDHSSQQQQQSPPDLELAQGEQQRRGSAFLKGFENVMGKGLAITGLSTLKSTVSSWATSVSTVTHKENTYVVKEGESEVVLMRSLSHPEQESGSGIPKNNPSSVQVSTISRDIEHEQ